MSSGSRREWGPIRQLSLEPTAAAQRRTLKKQVSEVSEGGRLRSSRTNEHRPQGGNAGQRPRPPVRVAWARVGGGSQERAEPPRPQSAAVEVVAKRCVGQPRPGPRPPRSPLLPDNNSLLLSRQQLTERLRQAWRQNRAGKLDIFLNRTDREETPREDAQVSTPTTLVERIPDAAPLPLRKSASLLDVSEIDDRPESRSARKDFELTILTDAKDDDDDDQGEDRDKEKDADGTGGGTRNSESESDAEGERRTSESSEGEVFVRVRERRDAPRPEGNPPPEKRPASVRRMNFKNSRGNAAFATAVAKTPTPTPPATPSPPTGRSTPARRPMPRTMSAPVRPSDDAPPRVPDAKKPPAKSLEPTTPNSQRNLKSAPPKRKLKSGRRRARSRDESSEEEEEERARRGRRGRRPAAERGTKTEVVTMVSLVSPTPSDLDTEPEEPLVQLLPPTPQGPPPLQEEDARVASNPPPPPILSLRRPPKAVSFKQQNPVSASGLAYAASYPLRRAPPSLLQYSAVVTVGQPQPQAQAQAQTQPRRKPPPLRSKTLDLSLRETTESEPIKITCKEKADVPPTILEQEEEKLSKEDVVAEGGLPLAEEPCEGQPGEPKFSCPKEKECWNLFRRMSDKGVAVSFETILRGMLTPTEYRMRKAALVATC